MLIFFFYQKPLYTPSCIKYINYIISHRDKLLPDTKYCHTSVAQRRGDRDLDGLGTGSSVGGQPLPDDNDKRDSSSEKKAAAAAAAFTNSGNGTSLALASLVPVLPASATTITRVNSARIFLKARNKEVWKAMACAICRSISSMR